MNDRVDTTKVDCRLAVTDSPIADLPFQINCREHEQRMGKKDNEASLSIYPDHLHCYGCGFHLYRRMDTLAYLLGISLYESFKVASKYTVESLDAYRSRASQLARRDPLPNPLASVYYSHLYGARRSRVKYLNERGLNDDTIYAAKIGHDGTRFTIPYFDGDDQLLTIRFRRDDHYGTESFDGKPIPKYTGTYGRNGLYLYPEWLISRSLDQGKDWLVVCEGEFDCLVLWSHGISAVTVPNGAGNLKYIVKLLNDFSLNKPSSFKRLYIASDQDEPGRKAAEEVNRIAKENYYESEIISWDISWGKDITDLYKSGRTLRDAAQAQVSHL